MNIYNFLNDRSNQVARSFAKISPKQRNKMDALILKELKERPYELAASLPFIAMSHDVKLSGKEAFKATQISNPDDK